MELKTPCIPFTGYRDKRGYGRKQYKGRVQSAHRVAYQRAFGDLPSRIEVHHRCTDRACVNLEHLVALTKAEHNAITHGRAACAHGHPFDEANTYIRPNGTKQCRRCNAAAVRRYKQRRSGP